MISSALLAINTLEDLPYYWTFSNCIVSTKYFTCSVASIIIIIASILDNAYIILLLSILIIPIAGYMFISRVIYLHSKFNDKLDIRIDLIKSPFQFERLIRPNLLNQNSDNFDKVVKLFADCHENKKISHNKFLAV